MVLISMPDSKNAIQKSYCSGGKCCMVEATQKVGMCFGQTSCEVARSSLEHSRVKSQYYERKMQNLEIILASVS